MGAGIAEGYVPEFNLILAVGAFLHSEATLIHGVGDIQKGKEGIQEGRVIHHGPKGGKQTGYTAGQGGDGAHILGDGTHAESAAISLKPHIDVYDADK